MGSTILYSRHLKQIKTSQLKFMLTHNMMYKNQIYIKLILSNFQLLSPYQYFPIPRACLPFKQKSGNPQFRIFKTRLL